MEKSAELPLTKEQVAHYKESLTPEEQEMFDPSPPQSNPEEDSHPMDRNQTLNLSEMKHRTINPTYKTTPEEKAKLAKAVIQLANLTAKATGQTPREVIKGMKEKLDRMALAKKN